MLFWIFSVLLSLPLLAARTNALPSYDLRPKPNFLVFFTGPGFENNRTVLESHFKVCGKFLKSSYHKLTQIVQKRSIRSYVKLCVDELLIH